MSEYHKIQSLYLRDPATKFKTFLEGKFTLPEFEYLKDLEWTFTEKIDGTNIRVYWDATKEQFSFGGRTDEAQMPTFLFSKLTELFTAETLKAALPEGEGWVLYGEGYGAKIQKGGGDYIPSGVGFILFDVCCEGIWLKRESVEDIARKLSIPCAPIVGAGTLELAVHMCKVGFPSQLRASAPEGLVIRPKVELLNRIGQRVITKLKLRDFHRN